MIALIVIGWIMSVGLAFLAGVYAGAYAGPDPTELRELRDQRDRAEDDVCALRKERDTLQARLDIRRRGWS